MNTMQIANQLYEAYLTKKSLDVLIDKTNPISVQTAYDIQKQLTNLKITQNNEQIIGYKISMTSEKMQRLAGKSNEPAYGTFTTSNFSKEFIQLDSASPLLLEPELVFILQDDLSESATAEEIISKSKIAAGLEIPGSRYHNWYPFNESIELMDIIADNAFAGKIILGEQVDIPPNIDWKNIHAKIFHNNQFLDEGVSSEVLGNPLHAVIWLNQKLQEQQRALKKGMFISSGTFTDPVELQTGHYHAQFDLVGKVAFTAGT